MNRVVAMIPARGGSKRLVGKNIFPVNGKPMILYTVDAAMKSAFISRDNLYISTEDESIKKIVESFARIIHRPAELAGDTIWTQDVIDHFTKELGLKDEDIVVILQANSPQISGEVIDQCIRKLIEEKLWQVHTVDKSLVNNGAIQVMRVKVSQHKGKANYNGVVITDWMDVHTLEDVKEVEKLLGDGN